MSYGVNRFNKQIKPQSTLLSGLVAYWPLDEPSGARRDLAKRYLATDNNTVGSTQGFRGYAARFVAASDESLSRTDNDDLSGGGSFTIAFWTRFNTLTGDMALVSKWKAAGDAECDYLINVTTTSFVFAATSNGDAFSTYDEVGASTPSPPVTGVWYFVVCQFDAVAQIGYISINNATPDTKAFAGQVFNGAHIFELGAIDATVLSLDGDLNHVGVWRRVLTDREINWLYNGGKGREYPFTN